MFSRDELKQEVMRTSLRNSKVRFHIGDVRDRESVDAVTHGVDLDDYMAPNTGAECLRNLTREARWGRGPRVPASRRIVGS